MDRDSDLPAIVPAPAAAPVASTVARMILAGFDRHCALFRYCAQRAKSLFESGDWTGIQGLARERIAYDDEAGAGMRGPAACDLWRGLVGRHFLAAAEAGTRLGRVVFYDYDEIQTMTEMNCRRIPPAPNEEAELASEPWYPVGANDVFPEAFARFLLGDPRVRRTFMREHAALLDADYWEAARARTRRGRLDDIFPYDTTRRFARTAGGAGPASRL